jgi:hypothetical protein
LETEVAGLVAAAKRESRPDEIGSIVSRLESRTVEIEKLVHALNSPKQPAQGRHRALPLRASAQE